MTSSIFLKKSTVSGTIPTVSELVSSELAINLGDGRLYYKNVTSSLVEPINAGTASFLLGFIESASFAETASFALNAGEGGGGGGAFGGDFSGTFSGSHTGTFIGDGAALFGVSASDVAFADVRDKPTLVSSSIQVDHDTTTNFSASRHFLQSEITEVGTVVTGDVAGILPAGSVSSSAQTIENLEGSTIASQSADVLFGQVTASVGFAGSLIGSFTGSLEATGTLTGTLIGSASFAENAMTAVLAVSAVTATTSSNANTSSFADPLSFTGFRPIKTVIADYNVLFGDYILLVDASSGIIDIVLPDTAIFMKGPASKEVTITKADAGVNTVQIMGSGSQTIIGDATSTLSDQYQGLTLLPSGNIWWVK